MKAKAILLFTGVAFLLTLAPAITNAQFAKGGMFFEGGLGNLTVSNSKSTRERVDGNINYNSRSKSNGFSIGIFPRVGFLVTNDLAIGTTLGINYSSTKTTDQDYLTSANLYETKISSLTLDIMPFARYYFGKSTTTRFYGQVGGGVSLDLSRKYEEKDLINGDKYKSNYPKKFNAISGEALVGVNHFVSQNVAINAGLGYRYNSSKVTTSSTSINPPGNVAVTGPEYKYTDKGGAFSWNVGFTMFIPCKKKAKGKK